MDMSKEFPAQTKNRLVWILDTMKENQEVTLDLLDAVLAGDYGLAKAITDSLYRTERDAMLNPEGIFTGDQIKRIMEAK